MKLSNQADVDRWLDLHVETAKSVLREAGFTEGEITLIASGEALWIVMLERMEHWKGEIQRGGAGDRPPGRLAAQILDVVDRIRSGERWAARSTRSPARAALGEFQTERIRRVLPVAASAAHQPTSSRA